MRRTVSGLLVAGISFMGPAFAAEPPYEIGAGDVLQILVLGQPSLSGDFTVGSDGIMSYPFVGKVKASGMSVPELERKLVTLLSDGYLRRPQVSITVKQYKSQRVYVTGEVPKPGPYGLRPGRMLSALLDDLGELGSNVGHEVVVIRPTAPGDPAGDGTEAPPPSPRPPGPMLPGEVAGAEVYHVNLRELRSGYADRDIQLQVGDTVFFPKAAHVYVTGHVSKPGTFPFEEGLTVFQVLNLAGGATDRGSEKGVRIIRLVDGKRKTIHPKLTDPVQPEDTVSVPERFF
jgi:polysaccharide export outer membrane protein